MRYNEIYINSLVMFWYNFSVSTVIDENFPHLILKYEHMKE